jgi:microcystin-dependent protein
MSNPFLGEIRVVGFAFAPKGWALCNGQILSIQQNAALFSLLGTTYGGNGVTTFALPNLQGAVPIGMGQGPGLTNRALGEVGGSNSVTLTSSQIPMHVHTARGVTAAATTSNPSGALLAQGDLANFGSSGAVTQFGTLASAGGNQAHENRQPYLGLTFVIALIGIFPSRS